MHPSGSSSGADSDNGLEQPSTRFQQFTTDTSDNIASQALQFQAIFELSVEAIAILNENDCISNVNSAACSLFNAVKNDLLGKKITSLFERNVPLSQGLKVRQKASGEVRLSGATGGVRSLGYTIVGYFVPHHHLVILHAASEQSSQGSQRQPETNLQLLSIGEKQQVEESLRQQANWEQLLRSMTQRIRQSLELEQILSVAVTEVRQTLAADRAIIFRLHNAGSGQVIEESVLPEYPVTQKMLWEDECFPSECYEYYCQGIPRIVPHVGIDRWADCIADFMQEVSVKSKIVAPITQRGEKGTPKLWGLLIVHACAYHREWQPAEAELLQQVSNQLAIAIQQSELYQQVQQLNTHLENQVQQRTAELEKSLEFEALLKRITDHVRDSLDEAQILETVVQEISHGLEVEGCDVALHDWTQRQSVIRYEYIKPGVPAAQGKSLSFENVDDVLAQVLRGETFQFCWLVPDSIRPLQYRFSILSCPIFDKDGLLGDVWLLREREQSFNALEVRLVQQVANQCAIAIRQARLYHAVQGQVQELERLNQLKDDFLSSVSHELRTPVSSIKMATQMLETLLFRDQGGTIREALEPVTLTVPTLQRMSRYLQILQDECQREINLITNLLDLTRLDAETEALVFTPINLRAWIPHTVESFVERLESHRQTLRFRIPENLPLLTTDLGYLQRILIEFLTNAYKYTPAGETIVISANVEQLGAIADTSEFPCAINHRSSSLVHSYLKIIVTNTGVEIPPQEITRIFDKFYRIPNNDPWRYGGTGLGLALVQKLANRLGATIEVTSGDMETHFGIRFPISGE